MVYLQWFQWWISDHDVYVGKNQVAYAAWVDLRDPEYVKLAIKPVNHFTKTWNDEIISILLWYNLYGTLNWFIYDHSWNQKFSNDDYDSPFPIWNILQAWWNILYSTWATIWRISVSDVWLNRNTSWDNDYVYNYFTSYIRDWANYLLWWLWNIITYLTWSGTNTPLLSLSSSMVCGIWRRLNNFQCFTTDWIYAYFDWANTNPNAYEDYSWQYKSSIFQEGIQLVVTWGKPEYSQVFTPWLQREIFATARTLSDGKKVFHFGRSLWWWITWDYMLWNDSSDWVSNIMYVISKWWLTSYWAKKVWMPRAWSIETTKNSVWDDIDVTAIKIATNTSWSPRVYFAWKSSTSFWVDYIDLDSTNYLPSWEIRTQKYTFWGKKTKAHKIKTNIFNETWTSVKLYVSVDWWSFAEFANLSTIWKKKYNLLNQAFEWHEIQFKFELITTDQTKSPKVYDFSFEPVLIDE